jgi:tetratricopeptide (TPR) repeat protein
VTTISEQTPDPRAEKRVVSPSFARVAGELLQRGEVLEAIRLCTEGLERHPWYATGNLILGQCHEELGRTVEALLEYRRALEALPDNVMLRDAVRRVETRQQEEFRAFAEEQSRILGPVANSRTFEEYVREGEGENAAEFLLQKPRPVSGQQPSPAQRETGGAEEEAPEIVTVTLAEIYAAQGQFGEAIGAYRKLIERRPEEAERFRRRITELEDLQSASDAEKPLQE